MINFHFFFSFFFFFFFNISQEMNFLFNFIILFYSECTFFRSKLEHKVNRETLQQQQKRVTSLKLIGLIFVQGGCFPIFIKLNATTTTTTKIL